MDHEFDQSYWERHWGAGGSAMSGRQLPVNPYLLAETAHLRTGTALDAGTGTGAEALWLAEQGWQVTGADISTTALEAAARRASDAGLAGQVEWIQADLSSWEPGRLWDLVVTSYAHPATGQLPFYRHIASWVAPGGTLLIVAHLRGHHTGGHGDQQVSPPGDDGHAENATATLAGVTELFAAPGWSIVACYENTRTVAPAASSAGPPVELNDLVVRLHRL
ncbi:hypothetical protein GCM10009788_00220 [Nocardioides humi]|uniref:Methyltransferase domain-containing protein n=1 Tax=Nocardioides humi TaxID=449461 RepID=A0ABN1ZNW4_9ACTN